MSDTTTDTDRIRSILNSLDDQTIFDPESSIVPDSFLQNKAVFLIVYTDQDCGL